MINNIDESFSFMEKKGEKKHLLLYIVLSIFYEVSHFNIQLNCKKLPKPNW